jgi:hypothetical protein
MSVSLVRSALTVAVAGASLWGGISVTNYVESSPALLYAAGEFRMAFGNEQAGLRLISRAEAIRSAKAHAKQVETCGVQHKSELQSKKVEVCTRGQKPAPPAKAVMPLPRGAAMMTPPETPVPPELSLVAGYDFAPTVAAAALPVSSFVWNSHSRVQHANRVKFEFLRKVEKIKVDAECKQAEAIAAALRTQTVDTVAIVSSVRSELKKRNVPEGAVMMLQAPVATNE